MSCLNIPRFKNIEIHIFQSSSHARPISFGRIVCKLCRAGETCAKTLTGFEFLWAYSSARWQAPAVPSSAGRTLAQYIFFAFFKPLYFLEMYTLITYILFFKVIRKLWISQFFILASLLLVQLKEETRKTIIFNSPWVFRALK